MNQASIFIDERVRADSCIDGVATIIGECLNESFIEGFIDYLDNSNGDNAEYIAKKLKILFTDYINKGEPSLASELGVEK